MADQKKEPASPTSGDSATANVNATTQSCQEKRVIVIDPGHGGTADEESSTWNNSTAVSGAREKALTLQYAQSLKQQLASDAVKQIFTSKNYCDVQVVLTRESDVNLSAAARLAVATQHKADIFLSIHFNGFDDARARGTEAFYRAKSNGQQTNEAEDKALAESVCAAVVTAMKAFDSKAKRRDVKSDKQSEHKSLWVLRDPGIGLSGEMCRTAMLEVEFITNPTVDQHLVSGANAATNREALMRALAEALAKAL